MFWIHTNRIIARVTNKAVAWKRPVEYFVRNAMRAKLPVFYPKSSISLHVFIAKPLPTAIFTLFNKFHKPVHSWLTSGLVATCQAGVA